jgi:predicted nucleic acid-binding protein
MPAPRPTVFVDTSAYVALARLDDEHHQEAVAILDVLRLQRARLYTTNFVVAETHALLLRYLGSVAGRAYLRAMDESKGVGVVRAEATDEANAKAIIYRYRDKDFSLTDAISFAVMERLGVALAFAFDRHFIQYRAKVLKTT